VPSDAEEIAQLKSEVQRLGRLVDALYVRLDGIATERGLTLLESSLL